MIRRTDIEQRTPEWHESRWGKVTGSILKDVYGTSKTSMAELKRRLDTRGIPYSGPDRGFEGQPTIEKLKGILPPTDLEGIESRLPMKQTAWNILGERLSAPMSSEDEDDRARGNRNEEVMLGYLVKNTGVSFTEGSFWESEEISNYAHSPDAEYVDADGKVTMAAEFKSPRAGKHAYMLVRNRYMEEYEPQLLSYFNINDNLEKLFFISYNGYFKNPQHQFVFLEISRESVAEKIETYRSFLLKFDQFIDNIAKDFKNYEPPEEEEGIPF